MTSKSYYIQQILFAALWVRFTWGFVTEEILTFLLPLSSLIGLLFDAVIVVLGLLVLRDKRDLVAAAIFLVVSIFSTLVVNKLGLFFYANGMRDFLSFVFVVPILRHFYRDEKRWANFSLQMDRFLFTFLIIQIPCLVWQFIKYGAGDHGGGSMGNGYSGIISTLIYLISYYLIQKNLLTTSFSQLIKKNYILIFALVPTYLNETKISFIFLAIYIMLLIPLNRKMFMRFVLAIPLVMVLMWASSTAYVVATGGSMGDVFSIDYYVEGYLLADDDEDYARYAEFLINEDRVGDVDVPRFTKLLYLTDMRDDYPQMFTYGNGIGHFKGGTMVPESEFFTENKWILIGSLPYVFEIIIQLGLPGLILSIIYIFSIVILQPSPGATRRLNLQLFLILLFVLTFFYNDSFRNAFFTIILFFCTFRSWERPRPDNESHVAPLS